MRSRLLRPVIVVATAAAVIVPATAAVAAGPHRPLAGKWTLHDPGGSVQSGTLTINRGGKAVTHLSLTPGAGVTTGCEKKLTISGSFKIRLETSYGAQYYLGKSYDPYAGTKPYRVTVHSGGHTYKGQLDGAFTSKRRGTGELSYGSGCNFAWRMRK